ncbi:uncharacterized protein LOC125668947 [Ostrea edulis]|uniref:uncharacterized protein LOC125668947 n=1 Tax=Ostrea edulis TaxID=37623 RepID=UPI0024AF4AB4|nr:uncharacterized protein LOC125668947 [Ostrea edulis]XP_056017137.1 uncharacterized protein LOC125668947 [Ostrea edulis]XP_056017138.1 uncharacterized protein LOC125668947 [Ostrea edulis]XP_056017139.1 uncharacterized protein LOC125668947 [Ostrea edulis]
MAGEMILMILITIQFKNVIMTKETKFKYNIDLEDIEYKFQCGTVECEGIRQFCTEDQTCQYCSVDLCKVRSSPPQCQIQCQFYQHQKEDVENNTRDGPRPREERDECSGIDRTAVHIIIGCGAFVVVLVLFIGVNYFKRSDKSGTCIIYNVRNQFHKCCRCDYPPDNPKNATHTRSMLEERPIDQSKDLAISVCDDTVLIVMLGVTIGVLMTIMVITVCTLAAKKYQHREIYIDDCLCRCRKRTVDEILRGYHTTVTSPNSS